MSELPFSLPPSSPPMLSGFDISENEALIDDMVDNLDDAAEEEDGEDLFGENMERDYVQNIELDHYDIDELDDEEEYEAMDPALRREVEEKLRRRDRELEKAKGLHKTTAFLQDDENDSLDFSIRRRRRHYYDDKQDDMNEEFVEELTLDALMDIKADSINEWILMDPVQNAISREFRTFLLEYTDDKGTSVYGNRIRTLGEINSESLEINYTHLLESKAILAYFLVNSPSELLSIFNRVAMETTLLHYPDYERIHSEIHVRIIELPKTFTLRELRQSHLNCLVKVSGIVTRRTGVFPQLKYVKFDCQKCGIVLGPFSQDSNTEIKIGFCHNCQSKGPFSLNSEKTIYRNYQKMMLQESPGTISPGRLPRHREVILLWDLIDSAKPGEEIEVTGIYKNNFEASLNVKNGFPVFATVIEANHISKTYDQFAAFRLTEEDEKAIRQLSKTENIDKKIIASIAPSIYGHYDIKQAIACSLFGGVPKDINGKHSIRGDINVLLLGDPGTAKSQFLKYVEKIAHRAVFATGQGASAVGLTASVRKDPVTGEWTLEGGALVLADKGVCLIDEFDKMNDRDRTSIHEAMEQQSISISKAGIVTTLQARCAVLAAANPIGGRYNTTIPFNQNVELTEPILSRFDILNIVKDTVDPEEDERLAKFVIGSHLRSHPYYSPNAENLIDHKQPMGAIEPIPQDLLRKYIMYAREYIHPKLHQIDQDKISKLYSDMRRESLATGSYPITVRHLESIIRISEAFAKMHLSEYVKTQHIDSAIKVIVDSFISAQKLSVKKSLSRALAKYILPKSNRVPIKA
ncbi:DNA replication licensing factor mcm2 [Pneumocystis murina B123]|uniref:DNA replication licensing factor MCM2 n=1 Tax=Pneumocystis murina (strain B123) TaxID=1069680 RepID=M7PM83_PNEMU|nr:DNA replication licensing factor mcm2 [Pneumocystis murina B123]EMR11584.1 DNA replication licensing factor mcm2 [Pneumocystis murina B123]